MTDHQGPHACASCGFDIVGIRVINRGVTRNGGLVCGVCSTLAQQNRLLRQRKRNRS